jgi:putative NADH-flavin reductase
MRLLILGATGRLGEHVLTNALATRHEVSVIVRDPTKLPASALERVTVHTADLSRSLRPEVVAEHDVLINCAGNVAEGEHFVQLFDHVVASVESLPASKQPVCWFLAGAALLDLDAAGRRGIELPKVKSLYWPHGANFERLQRSSIDWRLLCPGPMVARHPIGLKKLRTSLDRLPVKMPGLVHELPAALLLPIFASLIAEMIVPYADAAALMLSNLDRESVVARRRVGLALPVGMRGRKPDGTAHSYPRMS